MQYIISNKAYSVIKWAVLIVLPAFATLFSGVASAWGVEASVVQAIVTTITAVSAFGGTVLGVSQATAKPSDSDA